MNNIAITGISHDGMGVGRTEDGKVVFVAQALPGETVEIGTIRTHQKRRIADLEQVLDVHPERREPPCPLYGVCGGCALQHADKGLQAELKKRMVQDALERIGRLHVDVAPIMTMADPWRYRNKGIFHADYSSGITRLGFYAKGSHTLIPASECLLFSEQVNALAGWLENAITATGISHHIHNVMIRESKATADLMVVFMTATPDFKATSLLPALAHDWPQVRSVWHNVNTNTKLILGKTFHHLAGEPSIEDAIENNRYALSPQSFFQVNTAQTEVLYDAVKKMTPLQPSDTLLDLYCGIGTIGIHLANQVKTVIGVESITQAVKDAKRNATANGIQNATFIKDKAEKWLPQWTAKGNIAECAILDPPRKGCDETLLQTLIQTNIPTLTYVSCNPATLARDLKILTTGGCAIQRVQPVDMFPQTAHVETIVLLQRADT